VDPLQSGDGLGAGQVRGGKRPPGARRCLLKGCECWFRPARCQARYCSPVCQMAARRWRRWRAEQTYRATPQGKACRRAQSCRYRERRRERQAAVAANPDALCEGQRPAEIPEDLQNFPCDRPGCYELFMRQPRSPQQHFCSSACRKALRRVVQRERRQRERRRRGIRLRRPASRSPPEN
jgi:hypothetical protein